MSSTTSSGKLTARATASTSTCTSLAQPSDENPTKHARRSIPATLPWMRQTRAECPAASPRAAPPCCCAPLRRSVHANAWQAVEPRQAAPVSFGRAGGPGGGGGGGGGAPPPPDHRPWAVDVVEHCAAPLTNLHGQALLDGAGHMECGRAGGGRESEKRPSESRERGRTAGEHDEWGRRVTHDRMHNRPGVDAALHAGAVEDVAKTAHELAPVLGNELQVAGHGSGRAVSLRSIRAPTRSGHVPRR